jgi:hypothetical protein
MSTFTKHSDLVDEIRFFHGVQVTEKTARDEGQGTRDEEQPGTRDKVADPDRSVWRQGTRGLGLLII